MKVDVVAKYIRLSDEDVDTGRGVKQESDSVCPRGDFWTGLLMGMGSLGSAGSLNFVMTGSAGPISGAPVLRA